MQNDLSRENLSGIAKREEETLAFWESQHIFQKTLEQTKDGERFSFYDGPPFATGTPHYGHLLASTIKDAIPRYQTMRGRFVRRVWGWDCHGLPIENMIEDELGLGNKKDIEDYGIDKFNKAAYDSVLRYDQEWKKFIPRVGRWIDMEHAYKTMDADYTESVWWAFKTLYDKKLIYQGFKAMQICPRCETTLSNNEVADGYKDITDISVTVKFAVIGEQNTYFLAWTTTPWTLPGNVALAVNSEAIYCKVKSQKSKVKSEPQNAKLKDGEYYIIAKERIAHVLSGEEYEIVGELKGSELVGVSYQPLFNYYSDNPELSNRANGWKVYGADFVTMESGTGMVHIAPAFGEDDYTLGKKENLPFVQHVAMSGVMKKEVRDFAGLQVKPKDDHQATDILIIKHLAGVGVLFSKEKIVHSYPHCWRCKTPLLNYAAESWFVNVPNIKDLLVAENQKTKWVPEAMKDGRFGKWLLGAREWAISRSRYWGAPLPVWTCHGCEKREVFGSRAELLERVIRSGNRYLVVRHGAAESNAQRIVGSNLATDTNHLTEEGEREAAEAAQKLSSEKIDLIIASPFLRTRETAEIIAKTVGFDTAKIVVDERLREIDTGAFDGKPVESYRGHFASLAEKFTIRPDGGENLLDVKRRVMSFLEHLDATHQGKTILVVTHEYPAWMLSAGSSGANITQAVRLKEGRDDFMNTGDVLELSFAPFPHNADFEFDFHRPYIDVVPVVCSCGREMVRVPYVFDCWFESGSMPYAQLHYPFENKELFKKSFPADFIAEGVDQTRGWFYNMLVLATGLFGEAPFRQVIVNGLVLAEDGQKMSKSLKNYPDPWHIVNKYGADAMRYYLLSSPVVHAEDLAFSERGVDEVVKKIIVRTENVLSFYLLYRDNESKDSPASSNNPLDRWILSRLAELANEMTRAFDGYELDRAAKPIALFVDDLSTWYIRRSRDRFKGEDDVDRAAALRTTRTVLLEFAKLLAPVMPFLAEHLYREVGGARESVHLESWSVSGEADKNVLAEMAEVRTIVSLALEARAQAGVKVRQPLRNLEIRSQKLKTGELTTLIADEINVKNVSIVDGQGTGIFLDITVTPELKKEGQYRDLVRLVQELRKKEGLQPSDQVLLRVGTNEDGVTLANAFTEELKKTCVLRDVSFEGATGESVRVDDIPFVLSIER